MKYYLISDRKLYKQALPEIARLAERAGLDFFQLREKDLPVRELLSIAKNIRSVLSRTKFIVNGSLEVALASDADGVHLQAQNIPVVTVRSKYRSLIIGYSAHNYEEMKNAADQGASYLFISPVFQPKSKNSTATPLGPAVVGSWANSMEVPVFALGGITDRNQNELIEAGCRSIAGISLFIQDGMFTEKGLVA
jgi:thiamine-phosphate pyrophosphorylase